MTRLFVISGPEMGHSFGMEGDEVHIGRSPENEIQIKDRFVSRRHLKITRGEGRYYLEDLQSKNGTFVDGTQISPGAPVELGDGIPVVLGMSVLCLGEKCSEDILSLLDSMALGGQARDEASEPAEDRPMTTRKNMELLRNVSHVFSRSLNVHEILDKILEHIFSLFQRIDRGAIVLLDRDTGEISDVVSRAREGIPKGMDRYCSDLVEQVIEEGKGITIPDTDAALQAELHDTLRLLKIRSVMCVPLVSRAGIRGVIYVDSVTGPHGFRKDDLSLFKALSIPATNAIENAVLYASRTKEK